MGHLFAARAGLLLLASLPVAACRSEAAPDPEAVARYAERKAAEARATPDASAEPVRVRVTALDGVGIPDADDGPGETDAYLVIEHEGQRFETAVAPASDPAVWGDSVIFDARPGAGLMVTLMDEDTGIDERLGVMSEPMPRLGPGEKRELSLSFRGGEGGVVRLQLEGLPAP
ncbi:MAG: hypothetical protein H6744_06205 [Deltaproteobacteria bacterium]|nr:hypothetical protein [Deltaproteobacteria bacterium]MCB9786272.1 hypothetical protein [Deltaproteobacteria bacterium]